MNYTIDYSLIEPNEVEPIRKNLVNLLENHYAIMGNPDLLVEKKLSCVVIYPKEGQIEAIISNGNSPKTAEFKSANAEGSCITLEGNDYLVKFQPKVQKDKKS